MRSRFLFSLAGFFFLTTLPGLSQVSPDPWLMPGNDKKGSINAVVSRADLVQRYGPANVGEEEAGLGERRIEILWLDPEKAAYPSSVTISGKASRWHAVHGISLGMLYSDLAQINGKQFPISWGTDQGSVVFSWNGGPLDKDLKDVSVWFDDLPSNVPMKDATSIGGTASQKRRVNQITWRFPANSSAK